MNAFKRQFWVEMVMYARSPGALAWAFIFPVFVVSALGLYFGQDKKIVQFVAVQQFEESPEVAAFLDSLKNSEFSLGLVIVKDENVDSLFVKNRVAGLITIPAGFSQQFAKGNPGILFEPNPYAADLLPVIRVVLMESLQKTLLASLQNITGATIMEIPSRFAAKQNRYIDFLIPGMIGLQIMSACLWGIGFMLIAYRDKGNLKQLALTPVKKSVYISALISSKYIYLLAQVLVILLVGYFAFDVGIKGNILTLFFTVSLGMFVFMSIGFLVSSVLPTIELAIGVNNILFFLMIGFSGVFFSLDNLPSWAAIGSNVLPLTHFVSMLRKVMIDGADFISLWKEILILSIWLVFSFALSLKFFKWY
jgi:ABC-2 type transport system permease protein